MTDWNDHACRCIRSWDHHICWTLRDQELHWTILFVRKLRSNLYVLLVRRRPSVRFDMTYPGLDGSWVNLDLGLFYTTDMPYCRILLSIIIFFVAVAKTPGKKLATFKSNIRALWERVSMHDVPVTLDKNNDEFIIIRVGFIWKEPSSSHSAASKTN